MRFGRDVNVMEMVLVGEAMTTDFETVPETMALTELMEAFDRTRHHGFTVVDAQGRLVGVVTLQDLDRAMRGRGQTVGQICTRELAVLYPDQTLNDALRLFGFRDVGRVPVVDRADPRRLLGVLRRADIIRAYNAAVTRKLDLEQPIQLFMVRRQGGVETAEVELKPDSVAVGHRIRDIPLPEHSAVISVRRENQMIVPYEGMELRAGDRLTIVAEPGQLELAKERLVKPDRCPEMHTRYVQYVLSGRSAAAGRQIRQLDLGADCLVVEIKRGEELLIPHGETQLLPGDVVVCLARSCDLQRIGRCLEGDAAPGEG